MQTIAKLYQQVSRYQHVERIGNDEVQGLLQGTLWIQEKLDGANLSVSWDQEANDFIICSRQNVVYHHGECHNNSFSRAVEHVKSDPNFVLLFEQNPNVILRCEYLTKHKVPILPEFEGKVVIFDVETFKLSDAFLMATADDNEFIDDVIKYDYSYLHYNDYENLRTQFNTLLWLSAVSADKVTVEQLQEWSQGNSQYCEYREGIVIKNYEFTNKWGFTKWGKVISPVFDQKKALKTKAKLEVGELEQLFVNKFVTPGYVEKEIHKIRDAKGEVSTKDMGQIIGRVPYELFQDEMWRFLGKANAGEFNFRVWRAATIEKVREYALSYFNGKSV